MNKKQITKYVFLLISMFCSMFCSPLVNAEEVGLVQYTRGAVTMQEINGEGARLIAKNEVVLRGEVIKTGPRSFTIVKLKDGTRMTIRPNSSFSVEQFNSKKDSTASALLRLFRGGLRTITGYISKQNPNGYSLRTNVATIGIRGTEFDARLCQDDCANENKKLKESLDKHIDKIIARAVFVRGGLTARHVEGVTRILKAGSAIFEGDTLITKTGSYAILVFRDKSRISLQENTVFRVDEMKFSEKNAEKTSALFSLLRGGLRAVTGLIGKFHPKKYSMRTSVATIGIRGTGYDLMCTGDCAVIDPKVTTQVTKLEGVNGLYAHAWHKTIDFGDQVLTENQAAFKLNKTSQAQVLPSVPKFFRENKVPRPDTFKVDESLLFSKVGVEDAPPGLYVSVTEGEVNVKTKAGWSDVTIHSGESGYADVLGRQTKLLPKIPEFHKFDVYPLPDVANPASINLDANSLGLTESDMVCEIK